MSRRDKIVLTDKGNLLRKELEKETVFDFPVIRTSQTTRHSVSQKSDRSDLLFDTMARTPKAGYFGPKPKQLDFKKNDYQIYPNYLKRDPKEYPPMHYCSFREKPNIEGTHQFPEQIPKIKTLHHTLYHSECRTKLAKNPNIRDINKTIYKEEVVVPMNICVSAYPDPQDYPQTEPDFDSSRIPNSLRETKSMYKTLTKSMAWQTHRTLDTPRFKTIDPLKSFVKAERLVEKHIANQKQFEETLLTVDNLVREKLSKFEHNQNEIEEFYDKLKDGDKDIKHINVLKKNEEFRHNRRLKDFQIKKYEGYWRLHVTARLRGEKEGASNSQDTIHTSNMAIKGHSDFGDDNASNKSDIGMLQKLVDDKAIKTGENSQATFSKTNSKIFMT